MQVHILFSALKRIVQVVHLNHDMFNDVFKKSQIDNAYNKQHYKNPLVSKSIRSCSIHLCMVLLSLSWIDRIGDDYEFVYQKKEDDRYTNEEMKHIVPYIQKTDSILFQRALCLDLCTTTTLSMERFPLILTPSCLFTLISGDCIFSVLL